MRLGHSTVTRLTVSWLATIRLFSDEATLGIRIVTATSVALFDITPFLSDQLLSKARSDGEEVLKNISNSNRQLTTPAF